MTYVATYSGSATGGGNATATVTGILDGDTVVVAVGTAYDPAATAVTSDGAGGFTEIGVRIGHPDPDPLFENAGLRTWRWDATADDASVIFGSDNTNETVIVCVHLRGMAAAAPVESSYVDGQPGGVTNPVVLTSVTATDAGQLLAFYNGIKFGAYTWSTPAGMTSAAQFADGANTQTIAAFVQDLAGAGATGTRSSTASADPSFGISGRLIAIAEDTAPPPVVGVGFLTADLGVDALIAVEVAWGADTTAGTPDTWTWTDVTTDVRDTAPITTALGRGDEAGSSQPAQLQLVLDNPDGRYSLGGESANYPYVRQGTPVRLTIDPDDGDGVRVVLLGFAAEWVPGWDALDGRIAVVTLTAAGTLRRLGQGQAPLFSALRRALTDTASVRAYWPMEDGRDSTILRAVVGPDMTFTGVPKLAGGSGIFNCSAPIADAGAAAFTANVDPYTATGFSQVRFLIQVPEDGITDATVLAYIWTTGTLLRWDLVYSSLGSGNLGLYIYNADGTLNASTPTIGFDMNGKDRRLSLELTQSGTTVNWTLGVIQPSDLGAGIFTGSVLTDTFVRVSQVQLAPLGGCSGVLFGHLTVQDVITSLYESTGALRAHVGELASSASLTLSRLYRLCTENGLTLDRFTGDPAGLQHTGDQMGPQLPTQLLTLLRECETSDQGQLWDGRTAGLMFTTRRYRETWGGGVALTIDATAGELAGPWTPTHDDQRLRNVVTVTRLQGTSDTFEDTTGPRGTAVGIYDSSLTVNTRTDEMVIQHAAWQVALGTQEGYRVPTVTIDLRAAPGLAGAVLDLIPGDRIDVAGADSVLAGFPPGTVALTVEGIAHDITVASWVVTFKCSPWSPWGVAEFAAATGDTSAMVWRADTAGAALSADAAAAATSISVATTSGPLWTTVADDYPLQLSVGGIQVRATAATGTSSPQTITVDALPLARSAGAAVALWDPRPIGL